MTAVSVDVPEGAFSALHRTPVTVLTSVGRALCTRFTATPDGAVGSTQARINPRSHPFRGTIPRARRSPRGRTATTVEEFSPAARPTLGPTNWMEQPRSGGGKSY